MPAEKTDRPGLHAETVTDVSPASELSSSLATPTEEQQARVAEALAYFQEFHGSDSGGTVCPATDTRRSNPESGRWFEGPPLQEGRGIMGSAQDRAEFLESLALSAVATATQRSADVYVCPYPRETAGRKAGAATVRRHVHADVDGPTELDRVRSLGAFAVASGSSTGGKPHAHVYVRLSRDVTSEEHRTLCKALGQRAGGHYADAGKINDNDVLRVPGTLNHKTNPPRPVSWLVHPSDARTWEPEELARELGMRLDAEVEPKQNEPSTISGPAPQQTPDLCDAEHTVRRLERLIQSVRDAEPGNGNNYLNWAAGIVGALHARHGHEAVPAERTRRALADAYAARETELGKVESKRLEGQATVASGWRHGLANPAKVLDRDREPVPEDERITPPEASRAGNIAPTGDDDAESKPQSTDECWIQPLRR